MVVVRGIVVCNDVVAGRGEVNPIPVARYSVISYGIVVAGSFEVDTILAVVRDGVVC